MDQAANPDAGASKQPEPPRLTAQLVEDWGQLESLADQWDDLADNAIEGSPSSESWMLLPSLRRLAGSKSVKVVLIRAADPGAAEGRGPLCAVVPLEIVDSYHGAPVRTVRLWNHMYALLTAPLLRTGMAGESIRALFSWCATQMRRPYFIEFPELRADSEFFHELSHVLRMDDIAHHFVAVTTRAIFRRRYDAGRYLEQISTMRLRRYERRLSELGTLAYDELSVDSDPSAWLDEFIALEARGWKGRGATAFDSDQGHRAWLLDVGKAAAARGRLMMLALRLDGRPIAMKVNFMTAGGGYAFKTAFDETYAKYSPGTLLELEHIRRLHANPDIGWMDSLAGPEHALANRVWRDRTSVVTLLVAPTGFASGLALSLLPFARWMKRRSRGHR